MNFRLGRLLGFFSSFVILRFAMDDVRKRTNETAAVAARALRADSQQSEIFFSASAPSVAQMQTLFYVLMKTTFSATGQNFSGGVPHHQHHLGRR